MEFVVDMTLMGFLAETSAQQAMADLKSPKLMYLKALLLLLVGITAATLILVRHPGWQLAGLLALTIWAFCRAYYFAFYVVAHYVDGQYKFAGLLDFAQYLWRQRR